ncbi:Polyadenylate-binding protein, cytoplasmic and nuclear [Zancudomyces culisetae]|uniref:Polyadenylate-binding protein, cytoplasmic and nuclear n=1 Tax=Zancudomyces culisetae TaxID=1213189 RepID=A0A1R1PYB0_ZANCU|nr:Polyadenylate-binding protein, cytoplasmic and nuclear [Zancudomyces culisetae]|eukprot:OMH85919.1 Polyadenylate-binding protein, cytoplasmic and nuclear [Zancudomyces culisetae]
MKDRLRICPLPEDVDYSTLYDFMRVSGPIYELKIARNLDGVCTGVGYVKYFTNESGDMAFQELNFGTYKDTLVSLKVVKDRQLSGVKNNKDIPTMINSNCITNAADHAKPGDAADSGVVVVPGKLYVTNLHPTVSHVELFRMFKTYGYVHSARVSIDQSTGKSNGYGIVQMGTPEHATNALQALSGVMLKGKQVAIHRYEHLSEKEQHEHIPQRDRVSTEFFACDFLDGTRSSEYDNLASKRAGIQQEISSFSLEPNPSCSFSENPSTPPGLDASIIGSLSVLARSELLTQKIISELNNNTQYITSDAPEIITTLISLPLDYVIAILDSNALFPHEWAKARDILGENQPEHTILQVVRDSCLRNLKPHAASEQLLNCSPTGNCSNNSPASTPGFYTFSDSHKPTKKDSAASVFEHKRKHEHDSSLGSYNIDAEKYIDTLSSLSPSDKKQKLGAKLFPLVKGLGFSSPTRLTVYILDLYLGDAFAASNPSGLKRLVYSIYNSNSLREIATDVQRRSEADSFFHS